MWIGGGAGMAPLRAQIMHLTKTLHTTDRKMTYFYGARALNEVFYLEDFLQIEKDFPNFTFHLALDRPDPAADAAGVKYTPGFVHQVIYNTYLKDHEAPEDIEYYMCGPGPMSKAVENMLDGLGVPAQNLMFVIFDPLSKKNVMEIQDILRNLQIEQLTPMQEATREAYHENKDLVLLSPTGSGKTLAFLLPLVQSLKANVQGVQAVVLVPSRELALQIETVFKSMGTPFKAMSCYGGRPAMEEHRTMKGINPSVIIGTPGRMNDHLRKENFDAGTVTTLVIDEFDKCLEFGFHDEMAEVIGQLPSLKKRILLSATDAEEIPQFAGVGGDSQSSVSGSQLVKLNFLDPDALAPRLKLHKVVSPLLYFVTIVIVWSASPDTCKPRSSRVICFTGAWNSLTVSGHSINSAMVVVRY